MSWSTVAAVVCMFVAANMLLLRLPFLPSLDLLWVLLPVCVFGLVCGAARLPAAFVLGLLFSGLAIEHQLNLRLSEETISAPVTVSGRITGLPVVSADGIKRFVLRVEAGELRDRNLRLTWYDREHQVIPGQHWQFEVSLSKPTGALNFDQFDYEQWLFAQRIHGTGYVRYRSRPVLTGDSPWGIDRLRFHLREDLRQVVPENELATFFALTLGDTSMLTRRDWEVLNNTGTTHLLIVSGLHTGLIALFTFLALRLVGIPLQLVIAFTICVTAFYAQLAGWGLPVQRAFVMSCVVLVAQGMRRQIPVGLQFFVALLAVVLVNPLASLSSGFWLSFIAVFVLIYALGQRRERLSWLETSGAAQWVVFLALIPPLAAITGQVPMGSFLVNLIAIPWVGMLLVPLLFISLLALLTMEPVGVMLLQLAGFLVEVLWLFLNQAADQDLTAPSGNPAGWQVAFAATGVLWLLAPAGLVPRWPGLLLLLLLAIPPGRLASGDLRVTFLDVGQGLSVLLETAEEVVIYDTGPSFGDRFSAARQIVIPAVQQSGFSRVSRLIISHGDNDHAGGTDDLLQQFPLAQLLDQDRCDSTWHSAGVWFRAFRAEPGRHDSNDSNDSSCLLLVRAHDHWLLLTGDIESRAEALLTGMALPSVTVLSMPHHGSNSSSSPALLNLLHPEHAVVSAGYRNRFGHPDPVVLARYANRSVQVFNTAHSGAVRIHFKQASYDIEQARIRQPAIWRRTHQQRIDRDESTTGKH